MPTTPRPTEGRVPPHDLEAEQAVLGSVLIDPDAIAKVPYLRPDDFYRANNGDIWRAARQLFSRGEPIDLVTIGNELRTMGVFDRIGGSSQLALLSNDAATSTNIVHYAEIIRGHSNRRRGIRAAGELLTLGFDETVGDRDYISAFQSAAMHFADEGTMLEAAPLKELLPGFLIELEALERGETRGLSTGYRDLDMMLGGGLMPGDLMLLAGRASMGKTAAAINIGLRVALRKVPVAIFSLEMTREQIVYRIVPMQARVSAKRLKRAMLSETERRRVDVAAIELEDVPLLIDESNLIDEVTIAAKARQLVMKYPDLALIIVDYLQLIKSSKDFRGNKVHEVGHLSASLKQMARDLRVPVIALSQLSRAPDHREKDKRPKLSDLRDSGNLEQDADIVAFVFREDYYDETSHPGEAEIIVAKNRNGDVGNLKLRFARDQQRFDELDTRHEPPPEASRRAPARMYNPGDDYPE